MTNEQGILNKKSYGRSPTLEEVDLVKKILHIKNHKDTYLEDLWGLPRDTIKRTRYCRRNIPAKYWHWFYAVIQIHEESFV